MFREKLQRQLYSFAKTSNKHEDFKHVQRFQSQKGCPKRCIWAAKMGAQVIQHRSANSKVTQWPFGSDLERSWVVLGCFWLHLCGQKSSTSICVQKFQCKIIFLKKRQLPRASWIELGSIWVAKRDQHGSQQGAKTIPNCSQQMRRKLDRFRARF